MLGRPAAAFTRFGRLDAVLTRNIAAASGRELYQRVRVHLSDSGWQAEPVVGRSGLLRSLVQGDGLVRVPLGSEGLDEGTRVEVLLFPGATP
jgi:molybdopterin molybdotransferase